MTTEEHYDVFWQNETDWLVEVVLMSSDDNENRENLDWIGRLAAFAVITNTRALAQLGSSDHENPVYELRFSFEGEDSKRRFLDLVKQDGYADADEEGSFEPPMGSLREVLQLRLLTAAFPKPLARHITAIMMATATAISMDSSNSGA